MEDPLGRVHHAKVEELARDGTDAASEVNQLLCVALEDARRLQIPEAEMIDGILQQLGMSC